jgi:hypothetical protein
MGSLDVVDLPEHQRMIDPRLRRQPDFCAVPHEDGEIVALEGGWLLEQGRPRRDARLEVPCGQDDVREALDVHHRLPSDAVGRSTDMDDFFSRAARAGR